MAHAAQDALASELTALFTAETRLYRLAGSAGLSSLMVERWQGQEALSSVHPTQIVALSPDAQLALPDFIGEPLSLITTLADGSEVARTGLVRDAELLSGDGGLARYRLTTVPWLWYLTIGRHNRVFQDKTVIEIVEQVFADYAAIAAWQLADEVGEFLHDTRPRSYCVQYRESDYDFVARLLAEEGLGFHLVHRGSAGR
ncbi:Rhs element Vgr protein [Salinisphaera sp. S4-8]|uniref:type VI secretion system Vgr family protein n=1 Tax=Salinisphaera sp. S4-8 TaxID=633357 RepID=UPI0033408EED